MFFLAAVSLPAVAPSERPDFPAVVTMYHKRNWEKREEQAELQRWLRYKLIGLGLLTFSVWLLTQIKL